MNFLEIIKGLNSPIETALKYMWNQFEEYINYFTKTIKIIQDQMNQFQNELNSLKQPLPSNIQQPETVIEISPEKIEENINYIIEKDNIQLFDEKFSSSQKIFDTNVYVALVKKTKEEIDVSHFKEFFYKSIVNKPNILIVNVEKAGKLFGCFCSVPCNSKNSWIIDKNHKLFSYDYKTKSLKTYPLKNTDKQENQKSFYFKTTGEYLYAFLGGVIQATYTKSYSQIHHWIKDFFTIDNPNIFVGHNQLFYCSRTIVFQLK